MRYAALLFLTLPAIAQVANRPTPAAAAVPKGAPIVTQTKTARIPLSSLTPLEKAFDARLSALGAGGEPVDMLGATRGIYLDGYGAVFTSEIGLVALPTVNPFNKSISDTQKTRVHKDKVGRLPFLRNAISEMARNVATSLAQIPEDQQIVVAVRLAYAPWENTSGLPGLITAKADRRSAMAGNFQLEEQ